MIIIVSNYYYYCYYIMSGAKQHDITIIFHNKLIYLMYSNHTDQNLKNI